jgi:hypothetical protein
VGCGACSLHAASLCEQLKTSIEPYQSDQREELCRHQPERDIFFALVAGAA